MSELTGCDEKKISVKVVYALQHRQEIISLEVLPGCKVQDIIRLSRIGDYFPEICMDTMKVGIYGRIIDNIQDYGVVDGDRIEIYRPLVFNPMELRRMRKNKKI